LLGGEFDGGHDADEAGEAERRREVEGERRTERRASGRGGRKESKEEGVSMTIREDGRCGSRERKNERTKELEILPILQQ
jgi:hypothetical protein